MDLIDRTFLAQAGGACRAAVAASGLPREGTRREVKEAIEKLCDVKGKAVNTLNRKGKGERWRGGAGRQGEFKKAIVTLGEGHSIDVTTGLGGSGSGL